MLFGLRYFERAINNSPGGSSSKSAFCWGEVDMKSFAKCILSTCHSVREILLNEPRLLKIDSPTYILGKECILVLFRTYHDHPSPIPPPTLLSPLLPSSFNITITCTIIPQHHKHYLPPFLPHLPSTRPSTSTLAYIIFNYDHHHPLTSLLRPPSSHNISDTIFHHFLHIFHHHLHPLQP